jgi:hypothetical protein
LGAGAGVAAIGVGAGGVGGAVCSPKIPLKNTRPMTTTAAPPATHIQAGVPPLSEATAAAAAWGGSAP